jgi:hypothetical protein
MKTNTRTILLVAMLVWACCLMQSRAECIYNDSYCCQPPDRTCTGMDVLDGLEAYSRHAARMQYLADDFHSTQSGLITAIQIWGSYRDDNYLSQIPPSFSLAIFENDPSNRYTPYNHPGKLLWSWYGTASEQLAGRVNEKFYDPYKDQVLGPDHQIWQYDFTIPDDLAFSQQSGKTYWLGVCHSADLLGDGVVNRKDLKVLNGNSPWAFGWKTSSSNDGNAVFTDLRSTFPAAPEVIPPSDADWSRLEYPNDINGLHLCCRRTEGIGLAFSLNCTVPVPEPCTYAGLAGLAFAFALSYRRWRK